MLDPRSLQALVAIGGIEGFLHGLGTNTECGFSTGDASTRVHKKQEKSPEIVLMVPSGNVGSPTNDRTAFTASFNDLKDVYGKDILRMRISKMLLQLMWATVKDKVLDMMISYLWYTQMTLHMFPVLSTSSQIQFLQYK